MSFMHIQTNPNNVQIPTVRAVDQPPQTVLNDLRARGDQFKEQQNHGEGQTVLLEDRAELCVFQVKAVVIQVVEHFFNPHPTLIDFERVAQTGQIGG